jgi:hypothetical protein
MKNHGTGSWVDLCRLQVRDNKTQKKSDELQQADANLPKQSTTSTYEIRRRNSPVYGTLHAERSGRANPTYQPQYTPGSHSSIAACTSAVRAPRIPNQGRYLRDAMRGRGSLLLSVLQ